MKWNENSNLPLNFTYDSANIVQKGKERKSVSEMFWDGMHGKLSSYAEKGAEEIFKEIKI